MIRLLKNALNSPYAAWLVLFLPAPNLISALLEDNRYYAEIMYESGTLATQLMILALAITPLMRLSRGWSVAMVDDTTRGRAAPRKRGGTRRPGLRTSRRAW